MRACVWLWLCEMRITGLDVHVMIDIQVGIFRFVSYR